jgi:hypothetical protein
MDPYIGRRRTHFVMIVLPLTHKVSPSIGSIGEEGREGRKN